jgi:hypothetical protein
MTGVTPAPPATAGGGDPETAELAIRYLQSQLTQATEAYDSLDRKAALLPPFLAGAAGLLLGSEDSFSPLQAGLLVPALAAGAVGGWFAIEALRTRKVAAGPDPKDVAEKMDRPLTEFSPALAGIIAEAVTARRDALSEKATAFNMAMRLTAVTLLLVAGARLIGGLTVSDQNNDAAPSASPSDAASPAPSAEQVAPTPAVTDSPAPSVTVVPTTSDVDAGATLFGMAFEQKGNLDPNPPATTDAMFGMAYEQRSAADGVIVDRAAPVIIDRAPR